MTLEHSRYQYLCDKNKNNINEHFPSNFNTESMADISVPD